MNHLALQLREKLHRTCALLAQREAELQARLIAQARAEEGMERLKAQVTNLMAAGKPPEPGQGLVEDLLAARKVRTPEIHISKQHEICSKNLLYVFKSGDIGPAQTLHLSALAGHQT